MRERYDVVTSLLQQNDLGKRTAELFTVSAMQEASFNCDREKRKGFVP